MPCATLPGLLRSLLPTLLLAAPAAPAAAKAPAAALPKLSLAAETFQLDNGLTVIVSPDHSVPGVAVDLWYHVGSRDEEPGRTGFAHLFEHLMFMGARYVPYPRFDTIMEAAGGTNNAATGMDITHYHEVGPSNLLETFLWMEADRMATLGQETSQEKLESQRKIVLNERRQSYENRPYGMGDLVVWEHLYPEGHPYHHPGIGSPQDLEAAQLADVQSFFAHWYVPANVSLAVVGDVEPAQVRALATKYFGWMPKVPVPARKTVAPARLARTDAVLLHDKVELPKISVSYLSPKAATDGDAACDLLANVLAKGKASRLYESLVHQQQLATEVNAFEATQELQSTFRIEAVARPGHTAAQLLTAIDAELARLQATGPTQEELDAARLAVATSMAHALEGMQSRAELLNNYLRSYGDPTAIGKDLARYQAATPQSVTAVAREVLGGARVVIEIEPETAAGGAQ